MAASLRLEVRPTAECLQIAERVVADENDVAPAAAVAAVRPALRHVRFAAEAEAAVASGAGPHMDSSAIVHRMIVPCPQSRYS